MIPAAAPIASPVSILNATAAAPLRVCAGAVLVDEPELPPAAVGADAVEAGKVAVPVLLAMEVAEVTVLDAALDADDTEDAEDAIDTLVDEREIWESVVSGRWLSKFK